MSNAEDLNRLTACSLVLLGHIFYVLGNHRVSIWGQAKEQGSNMVLGGASLSTTLHPGPLDDLVSVTPLPPTAPRGSVRAGAPLGVSGELWVLRGWVCGADGPNASR